MDRWWCCLVPALILAAIVVDCTHDRNECVTTEDALGQCDAMTRAFDACGIVVNGMTRTSANAACEVDPEDPYWTCVRGCYDIYDSCSRWGDCVEYCDDRYQGDDDDTATDDDSWWDDDTAWGDDDTWWDDDTAGDDDTVWPENCDSAMIYLYETCGLAFTDEDGNPLSEFDAIALCWEAADPWPELLACIIDFAGDCAAIEDCLNDVLGKGGAA